MIQHFKRKRPLHRNGFLLHHDNVRPFIARCVLDVSQQNNVEILPHPPYSSDKAPCDFWLFPQLKKPSEAKRFSGNKAITPKCLCGSQVDRDRSNALPGSTDLSFGDLVNNPSSEYSDFLKLCQN
ncbi:histone-lysine N-methyltransferase SETMAR [Trichonephila clavipes]|nr:histone-lysine N-methyltransferase SETMAR [Trichonephila clavipes]